MTEHLSGNDIDSEIIILGAGIAGITCGITMQCLGFRTAIVSEKFPLLEEQDNSDKEIATIYAMASAYPHFLKIENLERVSDNSQAILCELFTTKDSGIEKQRIFEVFEFEPPSNAAALSDRRMRFMSFDGKSEQLKKTIDPPARGQANQLWGWSFESYFADMPAYVRYLWAFYRELGGKSIRAKVYTLKELESLSNRIFINCCGLGAIALCTDESEAIVLRGKQVLINEPGIFDKDGLRLAYNYTPTADVFSRADGTPEYVHFFSRSNEWLLGQTRERGKLIDGRWQGMISGKSELTVDGVMIPLEILQLNEDILNNWKQRTFSKIGMKAREAYRYYRDPENSGVRLEKEDLGANRIFHNYGLAGSGVTMSWGCAIECAHMALDSSNPGQINNQSSLANKIRSRIAAS